MKPPTVSSDIYLLGDSVQNMSDFLVCLLVTRHELMK